MKRIIFTVYDDIENHSNINKASAQSVEEYFDLLVKNKSDYAASIGVDFKLYHNTIDNWKTSLDTPFTTSNLYKHYLMDKIADDYDEVMYVDMDVIFNTTENVFNSIDLSKGIAVKDQDDRIIDKDPFKAMQRSFGKRNPTLKYHITKDLLNGKDNHVINTGVMIGRSEHIKLLKVNKRLSNIAKRIADYKNKSIDNERVVHVRNFYYPNNESIFSYILEKYKVPYQLIDDCWHDIRDDMVNKNDYGNVIHFINKRFNAFFNNKSKVVYSLYIKIDDNKLDDAGTYAGDSLPKSKRTQMQMEKYYDKLLENKRIYAQSIGANFIMYERDSEYDSFSKRYPNLSEYDIINLYKIYLLDKLADEYDYMLYLDFDVHARYNIDIFNTLDCDYYIQCNYNNTRELNINSSVRYFNNYNYDFRNPHAKYWNAHALLSMHGYEPNDNVYNTGIIAASKANIKKLDYFNNLDSLIEDMLELKEEEDSMYIENIQDSFGYDNETIFAFKVTQNNVRVVSLTDTWHYKHYSKVGVIKNTDPLVKQKLQLHAFNSDMLTVDPVLVHFISKQLNFIYDHLSPFP